MGRSKDILILFLVALFVVCFNYGASARNFIKNASFF
jgi:hypothetical protein